MMMMACRYFNLHDYQDIKNVKNYPKLRTQANEEPANKSGREELKKGDIKEAPASFFTPFYGLRWYSSVMKESYSLLLMKSRLHWSLVIYVMQRLQGRFRRFFKIFRKKPPNFFVRILIYFAEFVLGLILVGETSSNN